VSVFVLEQLVAESRGWTVVVLNEQWIYSRRSDAEEVLQRCQPDHDDEFKCWYRVRAINSYEALDLATKLEVEHSRPNLTLAGVR
jgi:hypothetical protein